ncbi:MAG: hypothetical protein NUV69_04715 [Candidatus Curtissbacteria bacterium]|nr:hypothetical protein [Candidatus Curtissbacteria bacterium]
MIKKAALTLISILVISFLTYQLFLIRSIEVSSNNCIKVDDVDLKGKLVFTVQEKSLEKTLAERFTCATEVKVEKKYPSKIKITTTSPSAVLKVEGTNLQIDELGLVTEGAANNLPTLFVASKAALAPGAKTQDETVLTAAALAKFLQKSDFDMQNLRVIDQNEIAAYDAGQTMVIFSTKKPAGEQVDSLQQVLAKARIKGDKIAKIDLRFDKPVITYRQ